VLFDVLIDNLSVQLKLLEFRVFVGKNCNHAIHGIAENSRGQNHGKYGVEILFWSVGMYISIAYGDHSGDAEIEGSEVIILVFVDYIKDASTPMSQTTDDDAQFTKFEEGLEA